MKIDPLILIYNPVRFIVQKIRDMATAGDRAFMTVNNGTCETSSCNLTSTYHLPALGPSEAAVVFSKTQIKKEMKVQTDGRKETKQNKREKTDREQR